MKAARLHSSPGVRCHFPTQYVLYPCSANTSDTKPFSNGIRVEIPGNPDENSAMVAMPLLVALRPVSSDAHVGEHNAVVWKFANLTPRSAMRRMFGVRIGPPNTSIEP